MTCRPWQHLNRRGLEMTSTKPILYLAPLRGVTDVLFRNVYCRHFGGFDLAIAPFLNPQRNPSKKMHMLADVLPEANTRLPIIPQLLDNSPEPFLDLAHRLEDLGYTEINWNLGCPSPMVANKRRGSGFLPYPDEVVAMLETVLPRLKARLSLKMRLGFRDREEILVLLPRLDDFPLAEIIIHPRIGKQMYKGNTDPDGFAACKDLTRHRLVYNGDITSVAALAALQARFPEIDRWMIGRGALADPFLAEKIRGVTTGAPERSKARLRAFHDELCEGYRQTLAGPGHLLGKMKQLWLYLHSSFPDKEKALKKIKKARSEEQFLAAVELMFS